MTTPDAPQNRIQDILSEAFEAATFNLLVFYHLEFWHISNKIFYTEMQRPFPPVLIEFEHFIVIGQF